MGGRIDDFRMLDRELGGREESVWCHPSLGVEINGQMHVTYSMAKDPLSVKFSLNRIETHAFSGA